MWGLFALYCAVGVAVLASSIVMSRILWYRLPRWKRAVLALAIILFWPAVFVIAVVVAADDRCRSKTKGY